MFFPLVVVAAVLPGLYALNWWDLNPPGPWWGLRGLAVLEGWSLDQVPVGGLGPASEAAAYRAVALQPPLYAWLEAIFLALSPHLNPLATVLPSYVAGVLVAVLVYWHGKLWRGPGLGLTAAVLTAFNRDLLVQMQQASPATLGLAGFLGALLAYGQYLRTSEGHARGWVVFGGLCLGMSLLSVGLFGLLCVPVVLLHQAVLAADTGPWRPGRWWRHWLTNPRLTAGIAALAIALLVAGPWHLRMLMTYGGEFVLALLTPPRPAWGGERSLLIVLLSLAPATLPLGLLAVGRAVRQALADEGADPAATGGTFWLVWLAVAALAPALWPTGPWSTLTLFLLVPLNLLAAQAMIDLAARKIAARNLIWLAPATGVSVAWWLSSDLRGAVFELLRGERPGAGTLLGMHLGLDLVVVLALVTRWLDRWARRRDDRRRLVLGAYLLGVLAVTSGAALREVRFRHVETAELLELRTEILRRHHLRPLTLLAVVSRETSGGGNGPPPVTPGGRLRFVLRTALPHLAQLDFSKIEDLTTLPNPPGGQRLVVLVSTGQGLSYRLQSQLGLEAIHAGRSGVLDAFATTYVPPRRRR
jgi:hypothetical protein